VFDEQKYDGGLFDLASRPAAGTVAAPAPTTVARRRVRNMSLEVMEESSTRCEVLTPAGVALYEL
jgi:hypothetical protein